jgi:hypothetical protein
MPDSPEYLELLKRVRERKQPITERGWFVAIYMLVLLGGLPVLYFLHLYRVVRWIGYISAFYTALFRIGDLLWFLVLIQVAIWLIWRGLKSL